mmetsp:Transcript_71624/g.120001  ORF Transcript_71624/g.120001 Transcript_71624/m.120001 type:complete len:227 (-) Transcript_71624:64-744(-)
MHPRILQHPPGGVGQEEVRAFNHRLELRVPIHQQLLHVVGRDRLRPAPAWHEQVRDGVLGEVERVPEHVPAWHEGAVRQGHVDVRDLDHEAPGGQFRAVEVLNHDPAIREVHELRAVQPLGVVRHPGPVNDAEGAVFADLDLVAAQVAIRPPGLDLGHVLLALAQRLQQLELERVHAERGHAVRVVRDPAQGGGLPCRQALPQRVPALAGVQRPKGHEVRRVLIRA